MNKKIAIMYDFDQTLSTRNMQEYSLLPNLNVSSDDFWKEVTELSRHDSMDPILTYMYLLIKKARQCGYPIRREAFQSLGRDIEYYPGVKDYFARINAYGKETGYEIEHFIISSGTKEIIEGCEIYHEFTRVFASEFHYDENGNADWPALAVDYTGKTQFIFRINKHALDIYDSRKVNTYIRQKDRDIPFNHMIYIGDGMTDVPCMRLVKANGGFSIGVYLDNNKDTIKSLLKDNRINFALKADYRENSEIDTVIKTIINTMAQQDALESLKKKID